MVGTSPCWNCLCPFPETSLGRKQKSVVVVTGAGRGIGLHVAKRMYRRGCTVIVTARSTDDAAAAAKTIEKKCGCTGGSLVPLAVRLGSARNAMSSHPATA